MNATYMGLGMKMKNLLMIFKMYFGCNVVQRGKVIFMASVR